MIRVEFVFSQGRFEPVEPYRNRVKPPGGEARPPGTHTRNYHLDHRQADILSCLVQHEHLHAPLLHEVGTAENIVTQVSSGAVGKVRIPARREICRGYQERTVAGRRLTRWISSCHDLRKKLVQFRRSPSDVTKPYAQPSCGTPQSPLAP